MTVRRHKLVTGGSDERDDAAAYASAEIYQPSTGTFTATGDMPTARYKHVGTSVLLLNGGVLIAGGARNAVLYGPRRGRFSTVPGDLGSGMLSRLFATATRLWDGSVLITGGYGVGENVSGAAWLYRP